LGGIEKFDTLLKVKIIVPKDLRKTIVRIDLSLFYIDKWEKSDFIQIKANGLVVKIFN